MTDYEEFLVPVEIAKELKEIGFNEPCLFVLNPHNTLILSSEIHDKGIIDIRKIKTRSNGKLGEDFCSVPTYEQVFAWFREKGYQFQVGRVCFADEFIPEFWDNYYCEIYLKETDDTLKILTYTYEEARLDCIRELIKIYKENI
nr:MAG TPA: hypothetical protein [Caudoviricetes sp.]